ncbi:hypothetical protein THAOC_08745, partial [Thalassiosira oceanica]
MKRPSRLRPAPSPSRVDVVSAFGDVELSVGPAVVSREVRGADSFPSDEAGVLLDQVVHRLHHAFHRADARAALDRVVGETPDGHRAERKQEDRLPCHHLIGNLWSRRAAPSQILEQGCSHFPPKQSKARRPGFGVNESSRGEGSCLVRFFLGEVLRPTPTPVSTPILVHGAGRAKRIRPRHIRAAAGRSTPGPTARDRRRWFGLDRCNGHGLKARPGHRGTS